MRRHAYRIMAVALYALPGVVVVAAVGAIYWISLVMKMRHLLGSREAPPRAPQATLLHVSLDKARTP